VLELRVGSKPFYAGNRTFQLDATRSHPQNLHGHPGPEFWTASQAILANDETPNTRCGGPHRPHALTRRRRPCCLLDIWGVKSDGWEAQPERAQRRALCDALS